MPDFIDNSGIFGWLILIIAAAIGILTVCTALALARSRPGTTARSTRFENKADTAGLVG